MKIGLKYCGGCNSKYDRAEITRQIREALPEAKFIYPDEESKFDILIVIAGCHVNCAGHRHLLPKKDKYFITDESEVKEMVAKIKEDWNN